MYDDTSDETKSEDQPEFTADWFEARAKPVWDHLIPGLPASRVLEIGAYEGASACYLIAQLGAKAPLEIHCIDTWDETASFAGADVDMSEIEARFRRNTQMLVGRSRHPVTLEVHKGYSDMVLARLLTTLDKGYFDMVYVDGSHRAPDVLVDAVLGFMHLRLGGIMVFDDYLWRGGDQDAGNPARSPKLAIDAFVNCNYGKVHIIPAPLYQLYLQKVSD
jgi:predicted O-methyltransferase YrrM